MPSGQTPKFNPTSELKSKLMRPALTSHYAVYFNKNSLVSNNTKSKEKKGIVKFFNDRQANIDAEFLTLSCTEASLPGSSLATHEINNDFTGVTERHVYRRQYDDRIDFTFYVDHDYTVLKFFETWMSWIVGEDQYVDQSKYQYNYRVKFPEDYRVDLHIQKFEKDFDKYVEYTFIGAYPISITSMPISYESSQLLKCTVSFSYIRYFMNNPTSIPQTTSIKGSYYGPGLPGEKANELWKGLRQDYVNRVFNDPNISLDYLLNLPKDDQGYSYIPK